MITGAGQRPGPRRKPGRPGGAQPRDPHSHLASRLTDRDRWLLRMLREHRVLTTRHLVPLAFPSSRAAQLRLATLRELGLLSSFRPRVEAGSVPAHWVLENLGRDVLAAEDGLPPPATTPRRQTAASLAHNTQLNHQLAVNTCLATLATTARQLRAPSGGVPTGCGLRAWWGQARCTRHLGDHARPDAYALLTHHHQPPPGPPGGGRSPADLFDEDSARRSVCALAFFLELDTGTETLARLAAKMPGYLALSEATAITTPVLIWLPSPTRERNVRHALVDTLAQLTAGTGRSVPVATASPATQLPSARGWGARWHPHASIWAPLPTAPQSGSRTRPGTAGDRSSLIELTHRWAAPTEVSRGPADGTHFSLAGLPDRRATSTEDSGGAGRARPFRGPTQLRAPDPTPPAAHTAHPLPVTGTA
jgi:hypothetical protein